MEDLKKILNNKENIILNDSILSQIVIEWKNNVKLSNKSKMNLYISRGIEKNIIQLHQLLIIIIQNYNPDMLVLLSLVLRYGGNNFYLDTPGLGMAHILIYVTVMVKNKLDISDIITIFTILGSDLNLPAFQVKNRENVDKNFIQDVFNGKDNRKTVKEWLILQKIIIRNIPEDIPANNKLNFAIMCDNIKLVGNDVVANLDKIIVSRSFNILKLWNMNKDDKNNYFINGEFVPLTKCIDVGCSEVFEKVATAENFSYFSMNKICLNLNYYYKNYDLIMLTELKRMLKYSISIGAKMDLFQFNILYPELKPLVQEEYSKPLWQKTCKLYDSNNKDVKILANNLNITDGDLCNKLTIYSKMSNDELKKILTERDTVKNDANFVNILDYEKCSNLNINPKEYNNTTLTSYTDNDGNRWCFQSNSYKNLLSTGINPNTNKKLPDSFKEQIKEHSQILEELGVQLDAPKSINDSINDLHKNDEINNNESRIIVNTIEQSIEISGLKLVPINYNKMINILDKINMSQNNFNELTSDHQYVTFCRAVFTATKNDKKNIDIFFTELNK